MRVRGRRLCEKQARLTPSHAGLRGAIAFSLALSVHTPHGDVIRTSTLIVVLVSVIGLGAGTSPMLRWLGIRTGVDPDGVLMSIDCARPVC